MTSSQFAANFFAVQFGPPTLRSETLGFLRGLSAGTRSLRTCLFGVRGCHTYRIVKQRVRPDRIDDDIAGCRSVFSASEPSQRTAATDATWGATVLV